MKRWQRKAHAQIKIAESNRGNEAGIVARFKIAEIVSRHPEARAFGPIKQLIEDDVSISETSLIRLIDPNYNTVNCRCTVLPVME